MSNSRNPKVVYIGSIPYDYTEEQVLDIAKSVGPVVNFRLIFDKDTGKSKGFAFVEYADSETASSAVRNLNNLNIGKREIKVDYSNEKFMIPSIGGLDVSETSLLPVLPLGLTVPPGQTGPDMITQTLSHYERSKLATIVEDCIDMAGKDESLLIELLDRCPQLSFALVQCLLLLGWTDAETVTGILYSPEPQTPASAPAVPAEASAAAPAAPAVPTAPTAPTAPTDQTAASTPVVPNATPATPATPAVPTAQTAPAAPAAPTAPTAPIDPLDRPVYAALPEEQKKLLRSVLELTDAQIAMLPEDQRGSIQGLRTRLLNGDPI